MGRFAETRSRLDPIIDTPLRHCFSPRLIPSAAAAALPPRADAMAWKVASEPHRLAAQVHGTRGSGEGPAATRALAAALSPWSPPTKGLSSVWASSGERSPTPRNLAATSLAVDPRVASKSRATLKAPQRVSVSWASTHLGRSEAARTAWPCTASVRPPRHEYVRLLQREITSLRKRPSKKMRRPCSASSSPSLSESIATSPDQSFVRRVMAQDTAASAKTPRLWSHRNLEAKMVGAQILRKPQRCSLDGW
mmetsp:Transcript_50283/g.114132  ORF Transcript_50283/g.114132 Transcript_50283/m.114132 type:complete len:251 (+) Transcript_50283:1463-2215(+)